ncbi:hypothetical protein [Dyella japonica]|uniref:hypothetical protein n=1 Tax=Dyella japonica TaxID=231455 RepID=UPI0033918AC3
MFAGDAAALLMRPTQAPAEVLNDLDGELVSLGIVDVPALRTVTAILPVWAARGGEPGTAITSLALRTFRAECAVADGCQGRHRRFKRPLLSAHGPR